jgi:hypothetical protein
MIGLEQPGFAGQNTGNFKTEKNLRIENLAGLERVYLMRNASRKVKHLWAIISM